MTKSNPGKGLKKEKEKKRRIRKKDEDVFGAAPSCKRQESGEKGRVARFGCGGGNLSAKLNYEKGLGTMRAR
jgi:hypothetical protein